MSVQKADPSSLVLLSLGSNIDPEKNIKAAMDILAMKVGPVRFASIWESQAVGSSGPNYLNTAALFHTALSTEEIKIRIISPIEDSLGRVRSADKYMDRTIDLDVLVHHDLIVDPEIWTQAHIALPASELLPLLVNEVTTETLLKAAERLQEKAAITLWKDLA